MHGKSELEIDKLSKKIYTLMQKEIKNENLDVMLLKPVPSPINKIKNKYRWRMILKCKFNKKMINVINKVLKDSDIPKFKDTSVVVDVNSNNMV